MCPPAEAPASDDWDEIRDAARSCRACPLWKHATQTVFGEGSAPAKVLLIGEQPGDKEDLEGRPFVGPAGKILDKALAEAGIDRNDCYVTNAVKHRCDHDPSIHAASNAGSRGGGTGVRALCR
jgi:uracil-DNA glycosylase